MQHFKVDLFGLIKKFLRQDITQIIKERKHYKLYLY